MFDVRPVGYVIGNLITALGVSMLVPMFMELFSGTEHWKTFVESSLLTVMFGAVLSLSTVNGMGERLTIQQTFVLTTGVWLALPIFGALPFVLGAAEASYVDAVFEAMSGLTTTGSTVFSGLEELPKGILLWRGMMQWFGGVGIIVVAMVFLPELRIGGMQIFRTEGFDTFGKILPRATQISSRISMIYLFLTGICALVYSALGMTTFDAVVHAMTTVATGGFANYDDSFGVFSPSITYAAVVFMIIASLPFVRYVQLVAGAFSPLSRDSQVRAFLGTIVAIVGIVFLWQVRTLDFSFTEALQSSVFNVTSILTGTGYASADYMLWGPVPVAVLFFAGLIGGCAGSTTCSIKIFRYQLLFASIRAQVQKIHQPHGIFRPWYDGRPVAEDVLSSVMAFFVMFVVSLGVLAVLLGFTGLDFVTSLSGAATALGNIGPGLGDQIGPAGNFGGLNPTAKWLLAAGMLIGRLELLAVYAMLTAGFWRG
ncbi:MAG: TrkH family potassium uptake protein [Paracoccaceae bacterium]|nr:TrkH family potassium uptake protein [Paracoccaceae bacterium]